MTTTPVSPYPAVDLEHAFPHLTSAQIDRMRPFGKVRKVEVGEILFEPGDGNVPFFVLLSGAMEIIQLDVNSERLIVTHAPGEFTGEMSMISGRGALVRGRVTAEGDFLELNSPDFLALVGRDAELNEILMRAFILRRVLLLSSGRGNVILMGSRHSANTLRLREFLTRNGHPHTYVDLDTEKSAQKLLDQFAVTPDQIPVVICNGQTVLRNPSPQELAKCLGLNLSIEASQVRDLVIVGAGPAGLAAAVYAASEGLDVLVIETSAPGGQAGSSSRIENYLGFPTGVSGQELAARAMTQAQKFGAKMMVASSVTQAKCDQRPYQVYSMTEDLSACARHRDCASGAQYNKPQIGNLKSSKGKGVYYGATFIESQMCGE